MSFYSFPQKISEVQPAIIVKENGSTVDTTITVEGTFRRPVFKQSEFSGRVTIKGIEMTEKNRTFPIYVIESHKGVHMSYLFYFTHKNVTDFTQIGTLWFEKGFEKINIKFTDDSQLVSPATNIEQASTIQNDLVKKFGEDWGLEALSLAK